MIKSYYERYYQAVHDTNKPEAFRVIDEAIADGVTPEAVVFQIIIPAIENMINALATDIDITISQHFIAAQVAEELTEKMLLLFEKKPSIEGRVVIGTPPGDFHGLGKKIVSGCLRANMFLVKDLGLNITPEQFVDEALAYDAQVIGISSMMIHTATGEDGPRGVKTRLLERGVADRIKLVVGGAPYRFDPNLYRQVQADAYADDGVSAAGMISDLIKEMNNGQRI